MVNTRTAPSTYSTSMKSQKNFNTLKDTIALWSMKGEKEAQREREEDGEVVAREDNVGRKTTDHIFCYMQNLELYVHMNSYDMKAEGNTFGGRNRTSNKKEGGGMGRGDK